MAKTDITAINAKTISVDGVPIPGSPTPVGPFTTFDQIDADSVLALNGVVLFGTLPPGAIYTNFTNLDVDSGVSVAEIIRYGVPSGGGGIPHNVVTFSGVPVTFNGQFVTYGVAA
jgi:hypothetical protein